jgi:hypothetical protein
VLATEPATGNRHLQVRRALDGALHMNIAVLGTTWRVIGATGIADVNGNARPELGVLAENPDTGNVIVRLRDYDSGALLSDLPVAATPSSQRWTVRLFNNDDTASLRLNGQLLGTCSGAAGCSFDVGDRLLSGANALRVELHNAAGGWAYGYRITRDGITWAQERCGTAATASCQGSSATGEVFSRSLNAGF